MPGTVVPQPCNALKQWIHRKHPLVAARCHGSGWPLAHSTMHVSTWQVKSDCAYATSVPGLGAGWWEGCMRLEVLQGILKDPSPKNYRFKIRNHTMPPDENGSVPFACFLWFDGEGSWGTKPKTLTKMLSWISKAPLGSSRCMDLDGLLGSQAKKQKKGFLGHLALAGRWVAYAWGARHSRIQDPKSTEKIDMSWKGGSGRPLVLKPWDTSQRDMQRPWRRLRLLQALLEWESTSNSKAKKGGVCCSAQPRPRVRNTRRGEREIEREHTHTTNDS